jgi:two-component system, response regulator RegA
VFIFLLPLTIIATVLPRRCTWAMGLVTALLFASARPLSVKRLEWEHIQRVLADNDGNISATARALGIHRRTLQRKLPKRLVKG